MLTTAENMINHALSTYTYDAENRIATRDVDLFGGFAGADEVEGGGARGGRDQSLHLQNGFRSIAWSTPKPMPAAALVTTAIRSWKGENLCHHSMREA